MGRTIEQFFTSKCSFPHIFFLRNLKQLLWSPNSNGTDRQTGLNLRIPIDAFCFFLKYSLLSIGWAVRPPHCLQERRKPENENRSSTKDIWAFVLPYYYGLKYQVEINFHLASEKEFRLGKWKFNGYFSLATFFTGRVEIIFHLPIFHWPSGN